MVIRDKVEALYYQGKSVADICSALQIHIHPLNKIVDSIIAENRSFSSNNLLQINLIEQRLFEAIETEKEFPTIVNKFRTSQLQRAYVKFNVVDK